MARREEEKRRVGVLRARMALEDDVARWLLDAQRSAARELGALGRRAPPSRLPRRDGTF